MDPDTVAKAAAEGDACVDASGVQNEAGSFQYGGAAACKTGTETFDWDNPSGYAGVQFGSGLAEGKLTVEVHDAVGRTVYAEEVSASSGEGQQGTSHIGVPSGLWGSWTIELTFENVTGTLGIQITASEGQAASPS